MEASTAGKVNHNVKNFLTEDDVFYLANLKSSISASLAFFVFQNVPDESELVFLEKELSFLGCHQSDEFITLMDLGALCERYASNGQNYELWIDSALDNARQATCYLNEDDGNRLMEYFKAKHHISNEHIPYTVQEFLREENVYGNLVCSAEEIPF